MSDQVRGLSEAIAERFAVTEGVENRWRPRRFAKHRSLVGYRGLLVSALSFGVRRYRGMLQISVDEKLLHAGPVVILSVSIRLLPYYTCLKIGSVERTGYFGQPHVWLW